MKRVDQSRLIRRLLREQDAVLEQLDELNGRIEETLKQLLPRPEEGPSVAAPASVT